MTANSRSKTLVLWVIWTSLFTSLFIYQFALGGGVPSGDLSRVTLRFPVNLAVVQLIAATVIRWLVIPRARGTSQMLVLMIVGLALSEAVEFYGLFPVPKSEAGARLTLWVFSLLSALQFAPTYAKSEVAGADEFQKG